MNLPAAFLTGIAAGTAIAGLVAFSPSPEMAKTEAAWNTAPRLNISQFHRDANSGHGLRFANKYDDQHFTYSGRVTEVSASGNITFQSRRVGGRTYTVYCKPIIDQWEKDSAKINIGEFIRVVGKRFQTNYSTQISLSYCKTSANS